MNAASPPLRWHILGTGSMGCLWAAYLAKNGDAVAMIARGPRTKKEYHAVTLETAAGSTEHLVELEGGNGDSRIRRLLVCTKAFDVLAALRGVAPRLDPDARVVLLQNGMGFQDEALRLVSDVRLFCAISTEGAYRSADWHVHHAGRGSTLIGAYGNARSSAARRLRNELPLQQLRIRAVTNIVPELWRKLAVNCAINALTAVHGCRNGELLDCAALRIEFNALCREISSILAALGHVRLAPTLSAAAVRVARATAANRSSMLQDVSGGRRTEIDYINGFLCNRAVAAGVPCPLNQRLCDRVHALERSRA